MIKGIILFMVLSISTFAFRISDTKLDLKVKVGEKKEKTFILKNDNKYSLRYKLGLENNVKGVMITPTTILIPAYGQKEFKVSVEGISKGEKRYKLILDEDVIGVRTQGSSAKIKMKYRIAQKYIVE